MANKIKKISDLEIIDVSNVQNFNKCSLLANNGVITGKVDCGQLVSIINSIACSVSENAISSIASTQTPSVEYVKSLEETISKLTSQLATVSEKLNATQKKITSCKCTENKSTITKLTNELKKVSENIEKYNQFFVDLQKDGYLTLAEIKSAASKVVPLEQTTEE